MEERKRLSGFAPPEPVETVTVVFRGGLHDGQTWELLDAPRTLYAPTPGDAPDSHYARRAKEDGVVVYEHKEPKKTPDRSTLGA